jgi:exosortase E/protease (VPEID-CTERM system)
MEPGSAASVRSGHESGVRFSVLADDGLPPDDPMKDANPNPRLRAASVRCAGLMLVLLAETVLLRLHFNVAVLRVATGWWSGVLTGPSALTQVAIAFCASLLVIGGLRLREIRRRILDAADRHSRWGFWFAAHLAAYSAVFAIAEFSARTDHGAVNAWCPHAGALLALTALLFWVGSVAPLHFWGELLRQERFAAMAGLIVGAAGWYAGELTQASWKPLSELTLVLVEALLKLTCPRVITDRSAQVIGTPGFLARVSPECSGYEGIGLICVFLATFFWTFWRRLRFPAAWALWPIGILAIWLSNAVRIAALILVGTHLSPAIALRGFHSQAGWLFFNLIALGLMAGALRSPLFALQSDSACSTPPRSAPAAPYLLPLLALIGMSMVAAAFSEGFDRLYPLKVLVSAAVLFRFRALLRTFPWRWSWPAALNGAVVFLVWIAMAEKPAHEGASIGARLAGLAPLESAGWIIFRVLGSVVTVPLAEELAFRGYLMRRFVSVDFDLMSYRQCPWWAVSASSLLFGLMHGRPLAGLFAGLACALAARRQDALTDAILAHAITNALVAAAVVGTGAWWLW